MEVKECFGFLERADGQEFQNLYYYIPNIPLSKGIRFIVDELDYTQFIDIRYDNRKISLYVDHDGNGLEGWWDDEMNLVVSEDESGLQDEGREFVTGDYVLEAVDA
ncbi:unnamed protein product [Lactuca saligna]|uniref:Uncharacterized protein n=1 Tax=Lactuca saligna TaxID=75948 RepID=A0AA35YZW2_LACSI|nr:unnamed protein product [Lactuca saligna]